MLNGGCPAHEKMTLFWHNHFATSIAKVQRTTLMFNQNRLIREHALGKFGSFLHDMSKDAAMIVWLDNNSNLKAHPNENYAREVMELFSLGVGHYTEKDIREAARAFTGWHTNGDEFDFNARYHDDGEKTVLGKTGNWNGDDVLDILLKRPDCAEFLVRKLYRVSHQRTAGTAGETARPIGRVVPQDRLRHRRSGKAYVVVAVTSFPPMPFVNGSKVLSNTSWRGQNRLRRRTVAAAVGASAGTDGPATLFAAERQGMARRSVVAQHLHSVSPRQLRPSARHGRPVGTTVRAARSSPVPASQPPTPSTAAGR